MVPVVGRERPQRGRERRTDRLTAPRGPNERWAHSLNEKKLVGRDVRSQRKEGRKEERKGDDEMKKGRRTDTDTDGRHRNSQSPPLHSSFTLSPILSTDFCLQLVFSPCYYSLSLSPHVPESGMSPPPRSSPIVGRIRKTLLGSSIAHSPHSIVSRRFCSPRCADAVHIQCAICERACMRRSFRSVVVRRISCHSCWLAGWLESTLSIEFVNSSSR